MDFELLSNDLLSSEDDGDDENNRGERSPAKKKGKKRPHFPTNQQEANPMADKAKTPHKKALRSLKTSPH
jgi:hypothetical protein